ncbi:winged helix-turn-helix transcriptional regulator [Pleomorphomonas sp. PLEO]|uniref:winged helix-turn-helix transcriptional regulator n=1 Tax=Pleomorphomonas sp. PLEO TaxID=3239306 RepID=UPI00351F16AA
MAEDTAHPTDALLAQASANRLVLGQIADKWSILILTVVAIEPTRFNALKRRLDGITHKALTEALRRLERSGLISRRILATSPVGVEYAITPLGRSLREPCTALATWGATHAEQVAQAQKAYDEQQLGNQP